MQTGRESFLAFHNLPHPVVAYDKETLQIIAANDAALDLYGYTRDAVLDLPIHALRTPSEREAAAAMAASDPQRIKESGPFRHVKSNGDEFFVDIIVTDVVTEGRESRMAILVDVSNRVSDEMRLRFLAEHDPLTGLFNRERGMTALHEAIAACEESQNVVVMFVDFDGFKAINDTLGHAVGDDVLRSAATRLHEEVGKAGTVARWGGDEFLIVLRLFDGAFAAEHIGERILDVVGRPYDHDDRPLHVSPKIGVSLYPDHGTYADALVRKADVAMYAAKRNERGFQLFMPSLDRALAVRVDIENGLREGLHEGAFFIEYQPVMDCERGRVIAAEALLRWRSPVYGTMYPNRFIEVAEQSGLIVPIGTWVLHHACQAAAQWIRDGYDIDIAVNVAPQQLQQTGFVSTVSQVLTASQLAPERLTLEVTENSLLTEPSKAIRTLQSLRALGVRIAIDDFGVGYSSFSRLKRLPLDCLKIDRSFIEDLPEEGLTAAIASAIIDVGRRGNFRVIAEGVEHPAQVEALRRYGCTVMQGFHFAKPRSLEHLLQYASSGMHSQAASR